MPTPDLVVLRSKNDPDLYIITERSRYRAAVDTFHDSDPDDSLLHVQPDRAEGILRGIVNLTAVVDTIAVKGLYRHRTG